MKVGILAFHGNVSEHAAVFRALRVDHGDVRSIDNLRACTHVIIPGGESTVMSRFLLMTGVGAEIVRRVTEGSLAVYGTCAGAILVSKKATGKNAPASLDLIDIDIERNAYGSQAQSFDTDLTVKGIGGNIPVAFIRAPIITRVGAGVDVLAEHEGKPVLVRQGNVLAGTCHPEARGATHIHQFFLQKTPLPSMHAHG